jgi:hypothetical protein
MTWSDFEGDPSGEKLSFPISEGFVAVSAADGLFVATIYPRPPPRPPPPKKVTKTRRVSQTAFANVHLIENPDPNPTKCVFNNFTTICKIFLQGEPLWLSGKVVKHEKINDIKRTRVRSPPRATSLKKDFPTNVCKISY